MEKEFKVKFLPDEKHVYVIKGTSVFEAANRAGILITAPCGGEGKCGKCRIKVLKGTLSEPTGREDAVLHPEEIKKGFRLSCQADIQGECELETPASSRMEAGDILVSGRLRSVKLEPGLMKKFFRIEKPSLGDHISYSGLIRQKTGCTGASVKVIRDIPGTVLDNPRGLTAVCRGGRLTAIEKGDTSGDLYGVALDLGTTTLAASLIDLSTGRELGVSSRLNPQGSFGDDLITRVNFAARSRANLAKISGTVISALNEMIEELANGAGIRSAHIYKLAVAGNTAMQHIFCRVNPASLGELPFIPAVREPVRMTAEESGINISPGGEVYVFPTIGGFVGGDAVSAILASGMASSKKIRILVDIGTNGEIIAGGSGRLLCASAAAGPAFESARISMGMIASAGAIEKVVINEVVHINVIGNTGAEGICGSGLIDAAAQMAGAGLIDPSGRLVNSEELHESAPEELKKRIVSMNGETAFTLSGEDNHRKICITQRDIRELQLAKSAIYSGIRILKQTLGVKIEDVEEILIAGAFGNFIRRSNAKRIGLIPDIPSHKIKFIGNASSSGAKLLLLSKEIEKEAERIADAAEHVELASSGAFQQEFAENMLFPEK